MSMRTSFLQGIKVIYKIGDGHTFSPHILKIYRDTCGKKTRRSPSSVKLS
jgi:hypothetical protein